MEFNNKFDGTNPDIAWCPGCGNYGILKAVKKALEELDYENTKTVLVSGIGQSAKTPQYVMVNYFNGLHGRALPAACGIKASNKDLKVIVTSGDGDIYGEGGNHFLHTIRRNPDITLFVFNNMTYSLTKGQASPTSQANFITKAQPKGTGSVPFNPIATAIVQNISFAARAFVQDERQTIDIMKEALMHKGFSLVDILTPCVTFNHTNTYKWFRENSYYIENHDPLNKMLALERELVTDKMPLGLIYKCERTTYEENAANSHKTEMPLYLNKVDLDKLKNLL